MRVAINQVGWFALRHHSGYWLGNSQGVICYEDLEVAKAALTIAWQRDGGGHCAFRIQLYQGGKQTDMGTYTPILSAEEALKAYERN